MKNIKFIFLTALIIMSLSDPVWPLETQPSIEPVDSVAVAEVPEPAYQFGPVAEGTRVTHEYVIYNRGTAPLDVLQVKTG